MPKLFASLVMLTLVISPALAQTKPAAAATTKSEDQADVEKARTQRDAAAERARAQNEGQAVNVRVELTITDARGDGSPVVKTVSIMTADRSWGRIRTQGEARTASGQRFPVILNVDARPVLVTSAAASSGVFNRARVELTIEYRPADEVSIAGGAIATPRRDPDSISPNINESLSVILEDGKPLVISQSADPVTDRKVKVEAKLSILR